nr:uncharacterized protein LOC106678505 isoform X2 [Halyomorpha halys]
MAIRKMRSRYVGSIAIGSFLLLLLCPFENRMSWNLRILVFGLAEILPNVFKMCLINIDWLYWCLLFVPFYAFYICVGEKLFMLKSHVNILQQDVSGKTKFIEWQNMALSQLDLRLVDLSKEVETLRRSNENFRKEEEVWRKSKELMKKKIREQHKLMSHEAPPIVREQVFNTVRQEILTLVKKNRSEGVIRKNKVMEEDTALSTPPCRASKSSNKSLPSIKMEAKKCASQEWERARMRLVERSKRIMKNRTGGSTEKSDEQFDKLSEDSKTSNEVAACLSTVHESETDDSTVSLVPTGGSKSASSMEVHKDVCLDPAIHSSRSSYPINAAVPEKFHRPWCSRLRDKRVRRVQSEVLHGGLQKESPRADRRKWTTHHD